MFTTTKLMIILIVHLIGAIVSLIWNFKNGNFEYAAKHGDGVRFATPADIIFCDVFLWEFEFLVFALELPIILTNKLFYKKYGKEN